MIGLNIEMMILRTCTAHLGIMADLYAHIHDIAYDEGCF